jgi:uncharacterized protein Smg (DUF494 family)
MNERIVEVLVYIVSEIRENNKPGIENLDLLSRNLLQKGYSEEEISSAFSWLFDRIKYNFEELVSSNVSSAQNRSYRILSDVEKLILSPAAYGYLIQLHQLDLINELEMDEIIERAVMMGTSTVSVSDIKVIAASMMFDSETSVDGAYFLFDNSYLVH